ncbi:MAG: hypothetical protein CMJ20_06600 [Phycisphaeraceae bacterium]|nr:hypothetical protein [Phycisphaeraceae bacterium]
MGVGGLDDRSLVIGPCCSGAFHGLRVIRGGRAVALIMVLVVSNRLLPQMRARRGWGECCVGAIEAVAF